MLSETIYTLRRKNGLSQEQLAEKIGVSRQAISKWEGGLSTPELDKLKALSECFQISIDELTAVSYTHLSASFLSRKPAQLSALCRQIPPVSVTLAPKSKITCSPSTSL